MGVISRFRDTFAPEADPIRSITAASERIMPDDQASKQMVKRRQDWQKRAIQMYSDVGEIHFGVNYLASAESRLRLFVGRRAKPNDLPQPVVLPSVAGALDRLRGADGTHAELLRMLAANLQVPGEGYMIGRNLTDPAKESWEVRSPLEIQLLSGRWYIKSPGNDQASKVPLEEKDFVLRVWLKNPFQQELADSPLRAILEPAEELLLLNRKARSIHRNRIASNGVAVIKSDQTRGPQDSAKENEGSGEDDPFLEDLLDAAEATMKDETDSSAYAPVILRLGKEDSFEHVDFAADIDASHNEREERCIARIAQGLNIPPEVITGKGDATHWNAQGITDDLFQMHVEPLAIVMVGALTSGYLWPELEANGISDARDYVVWYDPTDLVTKPNQAQDAKDAHRAIVISDAALRDKLGMTDLDAPEDEERARRLAESRGAVDPALTSRLLEIGIEALMGRLPVAQGETPEPEPTPEPSTDPDEPPAPSTEPAQPEEAVTSAARPRKNLGSKLAAIDRDLRSRLEVSFDAAMKRALERAGAVLRSKVSRDGSLSAVVKASANTEIARKLGKPIVASLGFDEIDAMKGGFDSLGPQFDAWVKAAQEQAAGLVPGMTPARGEALSALQAADRAKAWEWARAKMEALAAEKLYEPVAAIIEAGEVPAVALSVPNGFVTETLARAGGASNLTAGPNGTWLTVIDGRPAGGVAQGEAVMAALADSGVKEEGFVFEYGIAPRSHPFEGHLGLDQQFFSNWDDPVLEVSAEDSWLGTTHYYPGDHENCSCDFSTVLTPPPDQG